MLIFQVLKCHKKLSINSTFSVGWLNRSAVKYLFLQIRHLNSLYFIEIDFNDVFQRLIFNFASFILV